MNLPAQLFRIGRQFLKALVALVALAAAVPATPAHAANREPAPRLELSTRSLKFTQAGQTASLVVSNAGDRPLLIDGVSVVHAGGRSDFSVAPVIAQTIAPGQSLTYDVTFRPTVALGGRGNPRQLFAALQIANNDPRFARDPAASPEARTAHIAGVKLSVSLDPPLLSWLVFFPLLGIPLLFLVPRDRPAGTRIVALLVSLVPLAIAVRICATFDPGLIHKAGNRGLQFVEHAPWIRSFSVEYFLGVDGLSVTMVLLSALVSVIAVGASWSIPAERNLRGYFALLLLLEVGMMGVFVALDFFLFFVFWELMLLPMYFLIGIWGGPRKEYAAIKFFLYTLAGSVLLLLAIIALYHASKPAVLVDGTPTLHTFNLLKLTYDNDFGSQAALLGFAFPHLVWVLLFVAFAIKVPIVPLHTWLPDAHVEAPTAISVILAGVLLKMGTYALFRINAAILPEATAWASSATAWLAAISIVYGSLCAMAQTDLKRLVAYSSVAHMGFCLLGFSAGTTTGVTGAIVQMFNHGTITSMLFLLVGVLYDRTHTRGLDDFGGLAPVMPRYAFLFGLAFMASLGLPGLSGFIGEVMVFLGAFPVHRGITLAAALSLVLTAAYHLTAIQKVHFGPFNPRWETTLTGRDVNGRELATLVPLALIVVFLGCYPAPLIDLISGGVADLVAVMSPPANVTADAVDPSPR
ncbi:MAG TPA: NADH-quinone oxidoreductase subunit M [Polyangia bacterium]